MNEEEIKKLFEAGTVGQINDQQAKVIMKLIKRAINLTYVVTLGDHSLTYPMVQKDVLEMLD